MHDVFISYSHKDVKIADAICHKFEEENIRCWYAPRNIEPGVEWADAIINALDACQVMVLIFTEYSNDSTQVRREVDAAINFEKTIIPFKCTDTIPSGSMRYYLSTLHWMDALDAPMEKSIDDLLKHVKGLLFSRRETEPYKQQTTKEQEPLSEKASEPKLHTEKPSDQKLHTEKASEPKPHTERASEPKLHSEKASEPKLHTQIAKITESYTEKANPAQGGSVKKQEEPSPVLKQNNRKILVIAGVLCAALLLIILGITSNKGKETKGDGESGTSEAAVEVTTSEEDTSGENTEPASVQQAEETLEMETSVYYPPFYYYEGDDLVGINIEIAQEIAEKLGVGLHVSQLPPYPYQLPNSVQGGYSDFGMTTIMADEERDAVVNFTDPYYPDNQAIIVKEDSDFRIEDVESGNIGCIDYSIGYMLASSYNETNTYSFPNIYDAVAALRLGNIDCFIINEKTAQYIISANDDLSILTSDFYTADYVIAVAKENTELLNKINQALTELKADGTIQAIFDKYSTAN